MVGQALNGTSSGKRGTSHHRPAAVNIPLETIKSGHRMDPRERVFLEAVEKGDKPTVVRLLHGKNGNKYIFSLRL
jgi:hypothetical protein